MDYCPPGSSVHGISQARILELVAISFSWGSSQPGDWTCISSISRQILYHWATGKLLNLHTHLHRKGFECSSNSVIFSSVNCRAGDALWQLLPSSRQNKKQISTRSFAFFGEIRNGTEMPVFPHSHPTLAFLPFMFSHVFNGFAGGWNSQVKNHWGKSLTVQWLWLHTFIAEGTGSIAGQRTKILWARWHSQKSPRTTGMRVYFPWNCIFKMSWLPQSFSG